MIFLKSLKLRTINVINIINKFKAFFFQLFNSKISLVFIKNKYGLNDRYLTKIKKNLDF